MYLATNDQRVNLFDAVKGHKIMPDFLTPLTTIDAGKAFIRSLVEADMLFHFEDSPETIIKGLSGEPLFTPSQARLVRKRVAELYAMDWATAGHECPIGYALEVMPD